jgi:DNA-binding response OmpR family regulator
MAEPAPVRLPTVLLVEDDAAVAQMYRLQLELEGYLVLTAVEGQTGFSIAERFQPDLIVLDIGLPDMNGLTLLDTMRAHDRLRDVPIVILTNFDDPDTESRSLEHGARQFLAKSKTTPDALANLVRRLSNSN